MQSAYAIYNQYPIRQDIAEDDNDPSFVMGDEFAQPVELPKDVDTIEVMILKREGYISKIPRKTRLERVQNAFQFH
ncbi:hypothetical protein K469DRAFT_718900 [Zopfia rhizophila CBS 207.26]|uniref:Uncharacterized protein n=1 Tax=Zopfia rhizophila CBS 207.26 TaxID=1314779 RepID=A0A6A6EPL9_9PEZI|nr:hypothetical protein K469DRAFT_718900 [Zopfia rhizophila CBS 207.26]